MDNTSEKMLEVMERALQPHVMFRVVDRLSFDEAVALHDAFPSLWRAWTESNNFVNWFRRHLYSGIDNPCSSWRCLGLSAMWSKITFPAYVQHIHWHRHSALGRTVPKYRSAILQFSGMAPMTEKFLVKACIFLPLTAPSFFAGNLVLLGLNGELVTFRSDPFSYVPTSSTKLPFCPDAVCCSPQGSLLLLPSAMGRTSFMMLSSTPVLSVTNISIDSKTFRSGCFVDERSFLAWYRGVIYRYVVTCGTYMREVYWRGVPFYRHHLTFPCQRVFWFKTGTDYRAGYLVLGELVDGISLSTRLRVIQGPMMPDAVNSYITFKREPVRVCDCLFSPSQDCLFVMCIHKGLGRDFFSSCPLVQNVEPALEDQVFKDTWYGTFCFYGVTFSQRGVVEVTPRFYAGRYNLFDPVAHWGHLYTFSADNSAGAICTDNHLSLKFKQGGVCHFSLISTPLSQPYYVSGPVQKLWAVSRDHKHHVFFSGGDPRWGKPSFSGYRECPKYDRFVLRNEDLCTAEYVAPLVIPLMYV